MTTSVVPGLAPRITYQVLGAFAVAVDGRPITLGGKPKALLAALLTSKNVVVSSSALIADVWNDEPPAAASSSLQVAASTLRKAIRAAGCPDPLETVAPGYRLRVEPGSIDLDLFLADRQQARSAMAVGDSWQAAAIFARALQRWSGPALADLAGLRFAEQFATGWEEERLATIGDRIECDLACGRAEDTVGELLRLTHAYPLREHFWAQLIKALNASGRQADALEAARRLRTVLAEELGIDPSPELQALEQRVLRQELEPSRPAAGGGMLETITENAGPARAFLVDDHGRSFPVSAAGTRIGRMPGNDIVLDSGKVSRFHAVVMDTRTEFVVTDLNSTNGTTVSGERVIGNRVVQDAQVLKVGDTSFTFHEA